METQKKNGMERDKKGSWIAGPLRGPNGPSSTAAQRGFPVVLIPFLFFARSTREAEKRGGADSAPGSGGGQPVSAPSLGL